ncbi:unnamed protein product [Sympodiomycopsis kandeliae]
MHVTSVEPPVLVGRTSSQLRVFHEEFESDQQSNTSDLSDTLTMAGRQDDSLDRDRGGQSSQQKDTLQPPLPISTSTSASSLTTDRPFSGTSNDTTITGARYPSANEDYISSYYYGQYDHENNDDSAQFPPAQDQQAPLPRRPSAFASSSSSAMPLAPHTNSAYTAQPAPPPNDIILASPEELQRHDYFTSRFDPNMSSSGPVPSSSSPPRPAFTRTHTSSSSPGGGGQYTPSVRSMAMMGVGGTGSSSQEDDIAVLPFAAASAPRGLTTSPSSLQQSPLAMPPDVEDQDVPSQPQPPLIARSSADIYAMAGGDRPAVQQARKGINRFSKSVRRMSRRVIDLHNSQQQARQSAHVRLPDTGNDSDSDDDHIPQSDSAPPIGPPPPKNALSPLDPMGLRGRSLGFMGPNNRFRLAMTKLLSHWWIEPLILVLIIANLVMLIMQSARNVFHHPRKNGYFDYWEDYALLGVFVVYTVEVLARIVVSGLVINPPQLYQPTSNVSTWDVSRGGRAAAADVKHNTATHVSPDENPANPAMVPSPDEIEIMQGGPALDPSSRADLLDMDRRRMSKSNTLDAWAQLGDNIKTKAQHALRPQQRPPMPSRNSTMLSRMSAFDPDQPNEFGAGEHSRSHSHARTASNGRSLYGHNRSETMATKSGQSHHQRSATAMSKFTQTQPAPADDPPAAGGSPDDTELPAEKSKILRSMHKKAVPFSKAIIEQRAHTSNYAYLRHSWNRVDFLAVISFWIMFLLCITKQELTSEHHVYIFRALSVLRIARLLTITSGTSTILQSLKLAAPLLGNVLFFTVFVMLLFSIIGLQSFKGSYRRSCVWVGDINSGVNYEAGMNHTLDQICGGWYDQDQKRMSYIQVDGVPSHMTPKGYFCPKGSMCVESDSNPNANSQSFDNILTSLLQVVIIISSNGWSGGMYDMIAADYFASCLYFIVGLIFLNFWLANLFVAVITNTFATISAQTNHSAFSAGSNLDKRLSVQNGAPESKAQRRRKKVANVYKRVWGYTKYLWLAVIVADLSIQATRASDATDVDATKRDNLELYITIALDAEMVLRFVSYLLDDDWRSFWATGVQGTRNKADTFLAVITTIIQIPAIRHSAVYPWLTIFQLQRFYRVIVAVPRMERLLLRVFGSLGGLFNMILFLLLTVGLASIIAAQLFRGDVPLESDDGEATEMTFKTIYNSYLAMYQIFSSENWNDVLFSVMTAEKQFKQAVLGAIFLCGWFLFANFIVLQMFIAVLNEGFSISDAEKQRQQIDMYLRRMEPPPMSTTARILHQLSPYRWLKDRRASILGGQKSQMPAVNPNDGVRRALDAFDEKNKRRMSIHRFVDPTRAQRVAHSLRRILRLDNPNEGASVPLDTVRQREARRSLSAGDLLQAHSRQSTRLASMYVAENEDEAARVFAKERQLRRMRTDLGLAGEKPTQEQIDQDHIARHEENPRIAMARAINEHPSFDKTLWIFTQHNSFRRFCQSIVPSAHGDRIFGRTHSRKRYRIAQLFMLGSIIASVVVAGIGSPLYRKSWYAEHGFKRTSWFSLTEVVLSLVFFLEFFVKVVADGFAFTPNAYLLNPWNLLDLLVLGSLTINVATELAVIGGVSRFTRALKAFRALRLINLAGLMRSTFSNLIIGGGRFVDAGILAILYIIPFAIWGQNLFSGLLYSCTDGSDGISNKANCVGEYSASPSEWTFLAPRVWQNPKEGSAYSFDNFRSALLILFEIVSLEGWTDVMTAAMAIAGMDQQPQPDATQVNAIFFVIYNLIGAVFVLTLFVSVIIEGFQSATGAAFLSTEQRQWIDLKRLISRQRPSRRPAERPSGRFRSWCFDRATKKHDWWSRALTLAYIANLIILCTQSYLQTANAEKIRDGFYLVYGVIYAADVIIRFIGLGWQTFRRSWWCIYDTVMALGIIGNTLPLLGIARPSQDNIQLQKVFLTASTLKLVSRHNGLNQLFKTAISGLPAIASLLGLWLCLFLFFSIMFVEVFGLTKWGSVGPENYARNFSSIPLALIFLSMMSTGEGWNAYMHDYTVEPPYCVPSANYLETDCGSVAWAYSLFIAWNVTSMYIFLNMFTGTVVENFSYIFNLGGKPILGREDMRGFKRTWLSVAGPRNFLPRDKFAEFFRALPGKFDVRIYPVEMDVQALREVLLDGDATNQARLSTGASSSGGVMSKLRLASPARDGQGNFSWPPGSPGKRSSRGAGSPIKSPLPRHGKSYNVDRLKEYLAQVDHEEIELRRNRFNRMWHEAMILSESSSEEEASEDANRTKGLSFNDMLTLIAHYKLIDDNRALTVEELVERRKLNDKIDDRINLERVRGVMRMTYLRYRFHTLRAERQKAVHADSDAHHAISEQDEDVFADNKAMDIASTSASPARPMLRLDTSALDDDYDDNHKGFSPLPSPKDMSLRLSSTSDRPDVAELERRASPLLESFSGSAWGKMMRRVSAVSRDITSPKMRAQRKQGRGASSAASSAAASGDQSSQAAGEGSSRAAGQEGSAAGPSYYTLDQDDAWGHSRDDDDETRRRLTTEMDDKERD